MAESKPAVSLDVATKDDSKHLTPNLQPKLEDVICTDEVCRFRDLGLGRGVDATNPNMWANKSPFILRHIRPQLSNIIGTEEGGIRQYYSEEVSSLTSHQLKIKLSLQEPSSKVKVGIDAENSRSKSSTRKTVGAKVHTRTVSFQTDFNDLPTYNLKNRAGISADLRQDGSGLESFETQFCRWMLDRIQAQHDLKIESESKVTEKVAPKPEKNELEGGTPVEQLSHYLEKVAPGSPEMKSIMKCSKVFVNELGITHYVSAIELGALKYQVFTLGEYQNKFGAEAKLGFEQLAEATVSGKYQKSRTNKSTKLREVGKITEGREVKRNSSEEAVIGFRIEPIHKLVQLPYICLSLQNAVKTYVERKSDKSEGPFLISTMVGNTLVYWAVNQQYQLVGTPHIEKASPFYVIPTEHNHPCEFFISYYGKDKDARKIPVNLHDPMVSFSKQAPLPRYLKSSTNIFGYSRQPLELTATAKAEDTRFCLYDKIVRSTFTCLSTPVSSSCWIEGDEFFINCSRRRFQIDGYLAMRRQTGTTLNASNTGSDSHDQVTSAYTTFILPMTLSGDEKHIGMLFRLHPADYREMKISDARPHLSVEGEIENEQSAIETTGASVSPEQRNELPNLDS